MNPPSSSEEAIFSHALSLPPGERAAFLAAACAGDPARRARIEDLLRMPDEAPDFMATSAAEVPRLVDATPGEMIGRYKLLQKIGEGGIGVVFMAEQEEPIRRRVALKVIKLGMDTKEVIARFEAERQALALMDHPNIARVFDAGATASGRPYFVMELVRGIPITKFCDEQNLPTKARLELFTHVCHAVQHAHQKGIIHRDIKPSNILVTLHDGVPVPKVIDFGIAKATQGRLTDATLFTAFEQFIGTPAYMSPEQAEMSGLDIDTRSDIYSLGVLLYELLTGRPPFDPKTLVAAGLDEIRRIIREEEPPRPSTRLNTLEDLDRATIAKQRGVVPHQLSTLLRGDLDWIVMRCLEKDRTRRYETANGLARDVQRHLDDEPVVARPPAATYRLGKFVRRNKRTAAAFGMVILALATGTVVSTWQAIRAKQAETMARADRAAAIAERTRAVEARREAEASRNNEAKLRELAVANARTAETEAATSAAVLKFLENDLLTQARPDREPDRDIKLRTVLDRAAEKVDRAFANQPLVEASIRTTLAGTYHSLGEYAATQRQLERALELRERLLGLENVQTLSVVGSLINVYRLLEKNAIAEALGTRALRHCQRTLGAEHPETLKLMSRLATICASQGRLEDAAQLHRDVLTIRTRRQGRDHRDTAEAMSNLAHVTQRQGKLSEALKLYSEVLEIRRARLGPEHRDTTAAMAALAAALQFSGKSAEAAVHHAEALAIRQRTLGHEHPDTLVSMSGLAYVYRSQGKLSEAAALHSEALTIKQRVLGAEHPSTLTTMAYLAAALAPGKPEKAAALYSEVAEIRLRVLGPEHSGTLDAMANLAAHYRVNRRAAEAANIYARVLDSMKRTWGPDHPKTLEAMGDLASCFRSMGKYGEAAARQSEVAAARERVLGPDHPKTLQALSYVAMNWRSEGKLDEAAERLEEIWRRQKRVHGGQHHASLFTAEELGGTLLQMDAFDRAESVLRESLGDRKAAAPDGWHMLWNQWMLAEALMGLRRIAEAQSAVAEACELLRSRFPNLPPNNRRRVGSTAQRIVKLAAKAGEPDLATDWARKFKELGLTPVTSRAQE